MYTVKQGTQQNSRFGFSAIRFFQYAVLAFAIGVFSNSAMAEKININKASAEVLQYIPGIGPSKSTDIIELRDKAGSFKQIEELLEVPGIGNKTLEDIKKYGTLEGGVTEITQEMLDNPPSKDVSASGTGEVENSG